jgi:hypothetical protein
MVLHKTMQHGSTCSFNSAKELSNVSLVIKEIYVLQLVIGLSRLLCQLHFWHQSLVFILKYF